MTGRDFLDDAVAELGRLGVRAVPLAARSGVLIGGEQYTADLSILRDREKTMKWVAIIGTLVRGARA